MASLDEFRHMWNGTQSGWKLIVYDSPVYLVEFRFDDSGPNRREFLSVVRYVGPLPDETENEMWERLRECTGIAIAAPLGPTQMELLRQDEAENALDLTVHTIDKGDYLVLTPDGLHQNWLDDPQARLPVVMKMLEAGVDTIYGHLD
jgi:hypothetical protein